jgi:hypothetical protein
MVEERRHGVLPMTVRALTVGDPSGGVLQLRVRSIEVRRGSDSKEEHNWVVLTEGLEWRRLHGESPRVVADAGRGKLTIAAATVREGGGARVSTKIVRTMEKR